MSQADNPSFPSFGKLVPGFDFLQNLAAQAAQGAGGAAQGMPRMPGLGNWVAPTLNLEELDKRIQELKAVQFWLDQNAMALKATIQALEVQKMTLATLKGMNFSMGEVANAFKLKVDESVAAAGKGGPDKARGFAGLEIPPTSYQGEPASADGQDDEDETGEEDGESAGPGISSRQDEAPAPKTRGAKKAAAPGVVDPMQWWSALTQQFQTIATDAMKEAAKTAANTTAKTAEEPQDEAAGLAKEAVQSAAGIAGTAAKTMADGVRAAMNTALRTSQAWPMPAPSAGRPALARKAAGKTAAKANPKSSPESTAKAVPRTAAKTPAKTPLKKPAGKAARKAAR